MSKRKDGQARGKYTVEFKLEGLGCHERKPFWPALCRLRVTGLSAPKAGSAFFATTA